MTGKRINSGVYAYTFGDLTFLVIKTNDGDTYADGQKWYWVNEADSEEGGGDWFDSKAAAVEALCEYMTGRTYIEPYGWCYVPPSEVTP